MRGEVTKKLVYDCPFCEEEHEASEMDKNLHEAREAYRKENALLQVKEIKAIRELYGVYQICRI